MILRRGVEAVVGRLERLDKKNSPWIRTVSIDLCGLNFIEQEYKPLIVQS